MYHSMGMPAKCEGSFSWHVASHRCPSPSPFSCLKDQTVGILKALPFQLKKALTVNMKSRDACRMSSWRKMGPSIWARFSYFYIRSGICLWSRNLLEHFKVVVICLVFLFLFLDFMLCVGKDRIFSIFGSPAPSTQSAFQTNLVDEWLVLHCICTIGSQGLMPSSS